MSEANNITAALLIQIPARFPGIRVWRQNTGAGVPLMQVRKCIEFLRLGNIKAAISALSYTNRFGVIGGGDVSGLMAPMGRRLEIEVKAGRDKQSEEQRAYQGMILGLGGAYLLCRDVEVCLDELAVIYRGEGN